MKTFLFKVARFIKTAMLPRDYPVLRDDSGRLFPEVAVSGRSNVGKSSLLNHLFQHKGLVKTSSTPGKTQAINFFSVDGALTFVDLPGYGYAKVPPAVRKKWGPMVQSYLQERESLHLMLFLMDIRRQPNDEDRQLLEWVCHYNKAVILVLTKVDKVNQKTRAVNTEIILEGLGAENLHYVHYSVTKNRGRKQLMAMIIEALRDEQNDDNL